MQAYASFEISYFYGEYSIPKGREKNGKEVFHVSDFWTHTHVQYKRRLNSPAIFDFVAFYACFLPLVLESVKGYYPRTIDKF